MRRGDQVMLDLVDGRSGDRHGVGAPVDRHHGLWWLSRSEWRQCFSVLLLSDAIPHAIAARSPVRIALTSAPTFSSESDACCDPSDRKPVAAARGPHHRGQHGRGPHFGSTASCGRSRSSARRGGRPRGGREPARGACLPPRRADRLGRHGAPGRHLRLEGRPDPGRHRGRASHGAVQPGPRLQRVGRRRHRHPLRPGGVRARRHWRSHDVSPGTGPARRSSYPARSRSPSCSRTSRPAASTWASSPTSSEARTAW